MKLPKILAIDDQQDNLLVLKTLIEESFPDFVYLSAQSGQEGIDKCLAEKPDLILLDVVMPRMDGYEVCRWLKSNPATQIIPIVFVTAIGYTKDNRLKALECGADAFLAKPVDEAELAAQIKAMLRIKESEDRKLTENERLHRLVEERTKALEISQLGYQQLFKEMQLGFALHELVQNEEGVFNNYRWLDVNPAYELLTGLIRDEIVGKTVLDVLPETEAHWIENFIRVAQTGHSVTLENYSLELGKYFNVVAFCPAQNQFAVLIEDVTEKTINAEKLKNSEAQFREFFKKAADAIFIADIESGKITDVNIAATRLMKRQAHELIGLHQSQLHPPVNEKFSNDSFLVHKEAARINEVNKAIENSVIDNDGNSIPVEILASQVSIQGKPHLLGTFRDISDRKNAEKVQTELLQFQQSLIKTIPYGMDIVDEHGNIMFQNDLLENVFGKEAVGRKCWHLYCDDKSQCLDCPLFKGIEIGKTEVYTATNVLGGRTFEISHTGMMYKGEKAMLEIFKDITERVESNRRISLLADALENINECVIITDVYDNILYINQSTIQTYQYEKDELLGTHVRILRPKEQEYLHSRDILEQTKNGGWKGQLMNRRKDGSLFPISLSTAQVIDDNGQMIGLIGIASDITNELKRQEELKIAQLDAEESEKRYRQFISQVTEGVYRFEAVEPVDISLPVEEQVDLIYEQMIFVECNKAFLKMYGYQHESEVFGKKHLELQGNRYDQLNRKILVDFITNGYKADNLISEELSTANTKLYFSNSALGIVENGQLVRMWGTQTDVTEKIRNEKIREILSNISVATLASNTIEELTVVIREELGKLIDTAVFFIASYDEQDDTLSAIKYENDKAIKQKWLAENSATGYVVRNKVSLLLTDVEARKMAREGILGHFGVKKAKIWLGVPLLAGGKAIGAIVVQNYSNPDCYNESDRQLLELISSQITNSIIRKKTEQQLKLLDLAIGQSPVSVIITDNKGYIKYANPVFSKITGYQLDEILGKTPAILNSGYHSNEFYKNLWDTINAGSTWIGEIYNKKKNGQFYWESCAISPVVDLDGSINFFLAIKDDITEDKRLRNELIEAKDKAEESDRLKSAFLANMSHEIRTPLNSIIGFSDLISDPFFDSSQHVEFAGIIRENGNSLLNLLSDIMDFSKIDSGQLKLEFETIDLRKLMKELSMEFSVKATRKGVDFQTFLPDSTNKIRVKADYYRVRQVLVNLLSNALKFTEQGVISLSIEDQEKEIVFHVRDTGIGIAQENQQFVFERFRQVETAKSRRFGGNGLGLAISKNLVHLMGGHFGLESELGKGSKFYFSLPKSSSN